MIVSPVNNGHFEIVINEVKLDFFNVVNVYVSGYISEQSYSVTGTVRIDVDFGPLEMDAELTIRIRGDKNEVSAEARLEGKVKASVKIAGTRYTRTLAGITANLSFTLSSSEVKASASIRVKILGVVVKGSKSWEMSVS